MKLTRRRFLTATAMAVSAASALSSDWLQAASAQTYPSRPITMIVPFPPGGGLDIIARIVAPHMSQALGQPVIIENAAGAAGSVGVGRAARAAPDGYTLSIGIFGTHVLNGALYPLPYHVLNDFEPIALMSNTPLMIVAKKAMPAEDMKGLIAWLKANSDKASMATPGVGSTSHVAGVFFAKEIGTRFQFIPYRGLAPAMQALLGGQVDFMIDIPSVSLPQVRAGNIRAYTILADKRLALAPEIPTVDEVGLPGLHVGSWYGMWAPKGTPRDVITKLNAAVVAALADPNLRARFTEAGHEIYPREQQTPEALHTFQKAEIKKWWPIIRAANIRGNSLTQSRA